MKMKTTMAVIALAAFMAFAGFTVFENNASDAAGYELMGYGESSDATATKLGDVQAFYWENAETGKKPILRITLPVDPKSDVSVTINNYTGEVAAPMLGASVSVVEVVRSGTDISVYVSDLTAEASDTIVNDTKNYIVTITPLAGGDAYTTFLSTNPAGYAKVTFDANTGVVASGQAAYVEDYVIKGVTDNVTLPTSAGTYEKAGYTAGKWSADETSKAALIDDAGKATISADTTYYVMWAYVITFEGNGGKTTGDAPVTSTTQTEYFGVTGNLVANPFTFTDANTQTYAFHKWSDAADSIATLTDDEAEIPDAAHTYYAIWTYTIEFDKDATYVADTYDGAASTGEETMDPISVYLNGTALIGVYPLKINEFAYSHLDYLGWALASEQSQAKADLDTVTWGYDYETAFSSETHKATLYAVWKPHQYTVTISGLNADVLYYKATTYTDDPIFAEAVAAVFDETGKVVYKYVKDSSEGITFWDKFTIKAHGNYQINSVFYTIDGASTALVAADSTFTFTKMLTGDAVITISDKKAWSIYDSITISGVPNADIALTYNNLIFKDSQGLLIINKKNPVIITKVELYDYADYTKTPQVKTLVKDITDNKIADSRYFIDDSDLATGETESKVYHDVVIVVTYEAAGEPYTDFYLSDAQNNGDAKATAEVTMRSASDSEFKILAGSMKILGTYFGVETLGDESVVVYGALAGGELEMQANRTGNETFTPTISFVASSADLNIYWVYAQYTYTWDQAQVVDKTGGLLVVQTYDVTMTAQTTAATPVTLDVDLVGEGMYVAGTTVTLKAPTSVTIGSETHAFQSIKVNGTAVTPAVVEDDKVYIFLINADTTVIVEYN